YFKMHGVGETITLFTYLRVKEDATSIYGFLRPEERNFFEILLGVRGIGPKIALSLMGHLSLEELHNSLSGEDIQVLTKVPGIGQKTAGRLVYELKEKMIIPEGETRLTQEELETWKDVEEALLSLGYSAREVARAKNKLGDSSGLEMEGLFKKALGLLGG
ncbi:MAG: Holliday junction branch migration protein RuvA, partial [Dethiobacteria bacterium]